MITVDGRAIGHVMIVRRGPAAFGFPIVIGQARWRGRGYGPRAIRRVLKIGFGRLGYRQARLEVRPENLRAIRAYASLGFRPAGTKAYRGNPFQPKVLVMTLARRDFVRRRR